MIDIDTIIQTRTRGTVLTPYEVDVLINEIHRLRAQNAPIPKVRIGDFIGRKIHADGDTYSVDGFCGGQFGRDHYELERITQIEGDTVWYEDAHDSKGVMLIPGDKFDSWEELQQYILTPEEVSNATYGWF